VAKPFSDSEMRSVADIYSPETLEAVRAWKKAQKARGKSKAE
jgi:cytochrome c553